MTYRIKYIILNINKTVKEDGKMLKNASKKYIKLNRYLDVETFNTPCRELIREDLVHRVIKVDTMFDNRKQLHTLLKLLQAKVSKGLATYGELFKIEHQLTKNLNELSTTHRYLLEDSGSVRGEFSQLFEALVYFTLDQFSEITKLEYEKPFKISGGRITPDFYFNSNRIVEVKLKSCSNFRNKDKYTLVDKDMLKVYLSNVESKFNLNQSGTVTIGSMIHALEGRDNVNQENVKLIKSKMEEMIVYEEKSLEYDTRYLKSSRKENTINQIHHIKNRTNNVLNYIEEVRVNSNKVKK